VLATLVVAAAVASTVGSAPAVASNDTPDESGAECVPLTSISIVRASNGPRVTFRGYTYCHNLTGFVLKINTGIGTSGGEYSSGKLCVGPFYDGDFTEQEQCGRDGITTWYQAVAGPHEYCMATWLRLGTDIDGHSDGGTWSPGRCITYDPADDAEVPPPGTWEDPPPINDGDGSGGGGGGGGGSPGTPRRADVAMVYDQSNASAKIYRWYSTGSAFGRLSDYQSGSYHLSNVGDRVASGDVDGDGYDDVVMAYQLSDGTFAFYVFKRGITGSGQWYVSGSFGLGPVAGRLVVGDFDGDGRAEPALVRDDGDGTMTIWRWHSTGSSFTRLTDYHSGSFLLSNVGDRVAAGDVDGDGKDDIVMAYQLGDGTFGFYVFRNGSSSQGRWYTSGPFGLGPVAGRLVVGDFTGDGRAEPALARDNGDGTMRIYRWSSTGSSFSRTSDYQSGTFRLSNVGDRVASGDVTGDGRADIVMAYQNNDGTATLHVFNAGSSWAGRWYTGGQYNLANVAGRLVVGHWY
jgi:hypothetical protein